MEIWIDGYNLIRQVDQFACQERGAGLEAGRTALIRALAGYKTETGHQIVLVFDGDDGIQGPDVIQKEGIRLVFSKPPLSADDVIVAHLKRRHGKKSLLVVTSDREILREAKRHKISAMKSDDFSTELRSPKLGGSNSTTASEEETEFGDTAYWENIFEQEKGMFEE